MKHLIAFLSFPLALIAARGATKQQPYSPWDLRWREDTHIQSSKKWDVMAYLGSKLQPITADKSASGMNRDEPLNG